ncbi:hypothetical protein GQ43DRAFT_436283 [Delitschia confertaspora ATCC 74209]|uniref:Uncharacterized protein n=1 Tax=Delitschia confertaspora ATCC 74209 TaxID=1513339 RepID=A0A9P4JE17_9PLEO|nr:hypothetical protein GQ43DRAFT_436283 [Delitschia confertaspora ATCC 74209]
MSNCGFLAVSDIVSLKNCATSDVTVGKWTLPQKEVAMVASYVPHMNEKFWNSKNGQYPIDTFWAERFSRKAGDEDSGPIRKEIWESLGNDGRKTEKEQEDNYFDMKGTDGSWIHYGG